MDYRGPVVFRYLFYFAWDFFSSPSYLRYYNVTRREFIARTHGNVKYHRAPCINYYIIPNVYNTRLSHTGTLCDIIVLLIPIYFHTG